MGKASTVGTFVGVGARVGVRVGVAVDCGWAIDLEVSVSVGVAGEELVAEQPLAPSTSSVSQVTKMQREKNGKRDSDTMVDTSNKVTSYVYGKLA